jgi:aspartate racemase
MTSFLGVLGGMGPLATADFLKKIVENTPAQVDQKHVPILLYGDCTTPDRTANIVGDGPSPLPSLLAGIRFLNQAGVKAICIPCNSAHQWFADIEATSNVPVLHIARVSVAQVKIKNPLARVVGVMSTMGTYRSGIYTNALVEMGYKVLTPSEEEFNTLVSPGIAHVKANRVSSAEAVFQKVASSLLQRGADVIILGCTEIPIGMQRQCQLTPAIYIDSTEALAKSAVDLMSG